MIASSTIPPASTVCTTESGTTAIAPTWKIHEATAIAMPIANSFEENSWRAVQIGRRKSTGGRGACASVLVEEPEVGCERASEREGDAQNQRHRGEGRGFAVVPVLLAFRHLRHWA